MKCSRIDILDEGNTFQELVLAWPFGLDSNLQHGVGHDVDVTVNNIQASLVVKRLMLSASQRGKEVFSGHLLKAQVTLSFDPGYSCRSHGCE